MNGCVWERVSGYITNTDGERNRNRYGASVIAATAKYKTIYASGDEGTAVDGSDSDTDTNNEKRQINYDAYANSGTTYSGDAVLETSTAGYGSASWNGDYSNFLYSGYPFFVRGGSCSSGESAGVFTFDDAYGGAVSSCGFRAAIIGNI